ncbi:PAS domain S-box-containing protein [Endobacter medicaginis]|uniref:histidine kinase n=3 Tax=Endobacter medicaginis TaxID=1181271 RepID=A0A839V6J6_9PROT|nr:PAS domain-containing protein [Endobacter medicaginis]MBB3175159.1 PAS domain S-box-containing protein [Endobacter medicaginis]MCX5476505.1 PAS domain-containing protein [Endobacter medicaginis]
MPEPARLPAYLPADVAQFVTDRLADGSYGDLDSLLAAALKRLRETETAAAAWPPGDSSCAALARGHDWSASALGPIGCWPPALGTTVSNVVNSPVAKFLVWGVDDPVLLYNDFFAALAGGRHPAAFGATIGTVWPELAELFAGLRERSLAGEALLLREHALMLDRERAPEGSVCDLFFTPIYTAPGRIGGVMCTVLDITERVRAQKILTRRGAELQAMADVLPYLVIRVDRTHRYRFVNAYGAAWYGIDADRLIGMQVEDVIGKTAFKERRVLADRAMAGETVVTRAVLPDHTGRRRRLELHFMPSYDEAGRIDGAHVLAVDIEDTLRVLEEEHRDNTRFRTAMRAMHGVLWTNTADGRMLGEQPAWAQLTGQSFEQYQGYGWADAVHPDDAQPTIEAWERAVTARSMFVFEHRIRDHRGGWRTFLVRSLPILDDAGAIVEWVGVHTDITEQRRAEAALREVNETLEARVLTEIERRRGAEATLAHAQRLETIGQLSGGVAHDFNNLLQVIAGNLELLSHDIAGNPRAERRVANALAGVARGSRLSAQLLAFGRRQPLAPRVVDLAAFLSGMDEMLRRAVGADIEIDMPAPANANQWNCLIDPAQLENALLNLALNARDAMEGHGRLKLSLDHDGDGFVRLAVSDTGSGIAPEIIDKVCEPFFTTKAERKGSGLGLSMVYGFVTQSGGRVQIFSEPGLGTTVQLSLPRGAEIAEPVEPVQRPAGASSPSPGGSEHILVVEDDEQVRIAVVALLEGLGYRVSEAPDAGRALALIESGLRVDLLFTDVVMPGSLKSPELARLARQHLPGLRVLFTSGYTADAIMHDGRLDAGVELLSKPYTRDSLAHRLRELLDMPKPDRPAQPRVLLVEDDELIRLNATELLIEAGYVVDQTDTAEHAIGLAAAARPDILVTDINLPGLSGPDLARRLRGEHASLGVVFASGAVEARQPGALADAVALSKPYGRSALLAAVQAARPGGKAVDAGLPQRFGEPA